MLTKSGFVVLLSILIVSVVILGCNKNNEAGTGDIKGNWAPVTTIGLPDNRHECSFALAGDKGYLIGGRGEHPVEELDLTTNTWKQLASPGMEINHFQAVSYNSEIWLAGGFTGGFPHETPVDKILVFAPSHNLWREAATIPDGRRRGASGAFTYNNKIYIVGGITDGHWSGTVGWFDEYNPDTGQWSALPDAPHPRDHFNAVVIGDKLYLAGGRKSSESTGQLFDLTVPELDIYDFKKNEWTSLSSDKKIPTQRAGCAAINLNGQVVVIGGESGAQEQAHNNCEAFNPTTGTWTTLSPLNTGRHGTQAFEYKGNVYITAGSANRGGGPELNTTEKFSEK